MKRIAILASGSGTNAENIAKIFNGGNRIKVVLVVTNRKNAGVVERMKPLGVETAYVPNSVWDSNPEEVVELLRRHEIDLVVLAGFMHFVDPMIVEAYRGRILNIHPSLLPAYGGKGMWGHHVHEAVVAAGETKSGVTVHYVTEEMDRGEIVMQQSVEVLPDDTPETLEAKIHPVEYDIYPRAIVKAVERIEDEDNRFKTTAEEEKNDQTESALMEEAADAAGDPEEISSPEEEWARTLKIDYDPSRIAPPPMPTPVPAPSGHSVAVKEPQTQEVEYEKQISDKPEEPMPPTYLVWSVIATVLCCLVPGIVAIVMSTQVSSRYYRGDIEGAKRASRRAEMWIIASIVAGVISAVITVPLMLL